MMETKQEAIDELKDNLGKKKVADDIATRIVHRFTHGPEILLHSEWDKFTPGCVVYPETVEETQMVVRVADKYEIPIVPQGGRTCTYGAEGMYGCIAVDLARMDKIVDFDESNYRITVEAGMRAVDFINFLAEKGYMSLEFPTMNRASQMGSRAALHGYNKFEGRWGSSGNHIKALEVVLPNAKAVWLGRGTRFPTKSVVGYNLKDLFIGSRGTLGIITKLTERFIDPPPKYIYGISAFKDWRDAFKTYIDLKRPLMLSAGVWRVKSYHKWLLSQAVKAILELDWPEEVAALTDYHILGYPEVVEATERLVRRVVSEHNGYWSEDLPETTFIGRMHESMEKYMGMGAIGTERIEKGGMGDRIVPYDPGIPDGNLIKMYEEHLEHLRKMEDGEHYPALADSMRVLSPGEPVPTDLSYTKLWGQWLANLKKFDDEARNEFKQWFAEWANIIWRYNGSLTATHNFIPRDMEVDLRKRELGEDYYELMRAIKRVIDPKNIMNPKVIF